MNRLALLGLLLTACPVDDGMGTDLATRTDLGTDTEAALGSSASNPNLHREDILDDDSTAVSGVYWVKPGASDAIEMTSHDNTTRASKDKVCTASSQTLLFQQDGSWIVADDELFDAPITITGSGQSFATEVTASDRTTVDAFTGWSNHAIFFGGDFHLGNGPDERTTYGPTMNSVDQHRE
ncbi:MAG: hypothetical protein ACJA00_004473, partial [Myxococcota bacterium]